MRARQPLWAPNLEAGQRRTPGGGGCERLARHWKLAAEAGNAVRSGLPPDSGRQQSSSCDGVAGPPGRLVRRKPADVSASSRRPRQGCALDGAFKGTEALWRLGISDGFRVLPSDCRQSVGGSAARSLWLCLSADGLHQESASGFWQGVTVRWSEHSPAPMPATGREDAQCVCVPVRVDVSAAVPPG